MKEIACYMLGFATAVSLTAFGVMLAPDEADATERTGAVLLHLTNRGSADLAVGLAFAAIAFVCGSFLTSRAAVDSGRRAARVERIVTR